jgi:hypothetical protein
MNDEIEEERGHGGCKSNRDRKWNDVLRLKRTKNGMERRAKVTHSGVRGEKILKNYHL